MPSMQQHPLPILTPALRTSLAEHAARLKHDLGKYVALQQRWLDSQASNDEIWKALQADLLSTRRGPDGHQDAVAVWCEFSPELLGARPFPSGFVNLSADPDVASIVQCMQVIADGLDDLRSGTAHTVLQEQLKCAALEVAEACLRLARRARTPEAEWPIS